MEKKLVLHSLTFLFILFLVQSSFGQLYEVPFKDRVKGAKWIFEGEIVSSDPFYTPSGDMIYTSNLLRVDRVLKGNFDPSTGRDVEIITLGGTIDLEALEVTHSLQLAKGCKGLFFCIPSNRPALNRSESALVLETFSDKQGYIKFHTDFVNPPASDPFAVYKNIQSDLYNRIFKLTKQRISPDYNTNPKIQQAREKIQRVAVMPANKSAATGITYTIQNEIETGTNPRFLEFDIYAEGSTGGTAFSDAFIYVNYNSSAFGTDINQNGKLTVTKSTITNSSTYSIFTGDATMDRASITVFSASTSGLYSLNAFAEPIAHVKMEITNCNQVAGISFQQDSMRSAGTIHYTGSGPSGYEYYDPINATDTYNVMLCPGSGPVVSSFSPTTITAGTGSELTINGLNFGASRGNGKVFFRNAEDLGATWLPANDIDYQSWTDTEIRVIVPSRVDTVDGVYYDRASAASGKILVVNNSGDSTSSFSDLNIRYSLKNFFFPTISPEKARGRLADIDGNGGMTLEFNYEYQGADSEVACLKRSFLLWNCTTQSNFTLDTSWTSIDTVLRDNRSIIRWGPLPAGAGGLTFNWISGCGSPGNLVEVQHEEVDITFNDATPYYASVGNPGIPPGEYDFCSVVIHEAGHAHLVDHILNPPSAMHTAIGPGVRVFYLSGRDVDAAVDVLGFSQTTNPACSNTVMIYYADPDCDSIGNFIPEGDQEIPYSVSPNPFQDHIHLGLETGLPQKMRASIFNSFGEMILSDEEIRLQNGWNEVFLDTKGLSSGVYILILEIEGKMYHRKLMKR